MKIPLVIADVGATNSRLALVADGDAGPVILRETTLRSRDHSGLEDPLSDFLRGAAPSPERAVLAVAGPVVDGRAELTNLGWTLEEGRLAQALGLRSVRLVNDLVAMAWAVPTLGPESLVTLQRGEPAGQGARALVAPGTGLGQAFLTWDGAGYRPHPSEGGHADFAPMDELQDHLLDYLRARYPHVSVERVCSGRALPDLYAYLKEHRMAAESPEVGARLTTEEDRTRVIVEAALATSRPCPLSLATLELFTEILAAEAGNLALRVLATGGVYLGGGLPRRMLPLLERPAFLERFARKGRLAPLLAHVPLHVIARPNVGLLGAIRCALTGA